MPTLADVAREAGVSHVAASVVLNGAKSGTRTSAETRARVIAAAERLHYRPNATARALAHGRTNTIGIVTSYWTAGTNSYFMDVFGGVIEVATAAEQTTSVFMLRNWGEAPRRIPALGDGRVDGLIVLAPMTGNDASDWMPTHIPCVTVHANYAINGVVNLESDEEAGAFNAVSRMLALGHRRILHIAGPTVLAGAERRAAGYFRAYAAAGLTPPADHVVHAQLHTTGGRDAMQEWLLRHPELQTPEAIFCFNDAIAIGCLEALTMRGLRVPDDLSVVGFDDTYLAQNARMSTVRQPLHAFGRRAAEVLLEQISARQAGSPWQGPDKIVLPTELVLRETLAAPRRLR
jgi:LacI family transcriptional regulator